MKTQYYTATSLDGFIADADHSLDWLDRAAAGVEDTGYDEFIRDVGGLAMGSSTYEWVLRNHIYKDPDEPKAWPYDDPAWVFTTRELKKVPGADIRFVSGDVVPVYEAIREAIGEKNLWIAGGGDLAGQFWDAGLLDELIFHVAPATLGAGAPLLPRAISDPPLRLTSVRQCGPLVELRYEIART